MASMLILHLHDNVGITVFLGAIPIDIGSTIHNKSESAAQVSLAMERQ